MHIQIDTGGGKVFVPQVWRGDDVIGRLDWRRLAVAVGLMCVTAAAPVPIHRIVAVGDLHGDFAAWRAIVRAAGLVGADGHWTGGGATLVQVGDAVDRGPDSLKIVEDLMRLQREAARAHGRVVALVGNHEAMNVTDDLRYVSAADFAAYADARSAALRERVYAANQPAIAAAARRDNPALDDAAVKAAWLAATPLGKLEHMAAWHADGRIGRWVTGNPAVLLLGDTLFVHGGIGPAYAQVPVAEINTRVAAALKAGSTAPDAIINDEAGPLWYRGLAAPAPGAPPIAAQLDALFAATGARRIVIAHTPVLSGIAVSEGGRLIRVDTGISAVYKGTPSYLDIVDGVAVPHAVARPAVQGDQAK